VCARGLKAAVHDGSPCSLLLGAADCVSRRPLATDRVQRVLDGLIARGRFRAFPGAMLHEAARVREWMFAQLGATRGDFLDDLFPAAARLVSRGSATCRRGLLEPARLFDVSK